MIAIAEIALTHLHTAGPVDSDVPGPGVAASGARHGIGGVFLHSFYHTEILSREGWIAINIRKY
jgi:hypothetical protein